MKKIPFFIPFVLVVAFMQTGCGPKAFTEGAYDDPNKVILLDDKFNENDMQLVANQLVNSVSQYVSQKNLSPSPVVMVGRVRNHTAEHIDVKSLTDKIRVALIQSGKFKFSDKEVREELAEEYEYEGSGAVEKKTAKEKGGQIGVDYLLTGDIASNVQEVGNDKVVYYKVTLNLNNLVTNIIEWSDNKEVRKIYRKKSVGF